MKTGLIKKQKTTSIFFTDADDMIEVYTHNTPLKTGLLPLPKNTRQNVV